MLLNAGIGTQAVLGRGRPAVELSARFKAIPSVA